MSKIRSGLGPVRRGFVQCVWIDSRDHGFPCTSVTTWPSTGANIFTLAQWLKTNTLPGISQEAVFRCAISRAYYAAFGHAFDYATSYLAFSPRNDVDDHGRLRAHLKQKKAAKGVRIARSPARMAE